ncbi:MAG: hypothetical protein HDQ96_08080 [Lachnospiraceae bacterium]|nr:hypothetical protein [Lachnospiraceae bacterium]
MSLCSLKMNSRKLMLPVEVNIIMPEIPHTWKKSPKEFYDCGEKYKVLWLLHGATGDSWTWIHNTNLMRYAEEKNLIVVMPNALNSDYANHPEFANGYYYTDFFFEELMPMIFGWFPASEKREDNFISGMSMGGSGTLLLGFRHPEKFGGIAPISASLRESKFLKPYADFSAEEFRKMASVEPEKFPSEYEEGGITYKEINMIAKYDTVRAYLDSYECMWERFPELVLAGNLPEIYFCCGTKEVCYPKIMEFKEYAESLGVHNIIYDVNSGYGHDFAFWDIAIQKIIHWIFKESSAEK